jgi:hypothetical protein
VSILGRIAVGGSVLFGGRNRYLSPPITDKGDGEREALSWLLGQGK